MTKLFIAFEGIIAERDPALFSLSEEVALIQQLSTQQSSEESKEKQKEQVKLLLTQEEISILLSPEANISQEKSVHILKIDEVFTTDAYQAKVEVKLLPNVKETLEKLQHFERVILIQAVWLERAHHLVQKVINELGGLIDQYLYIPAKEDALIQTFKSYSQSNPMTECIFVTNSFSQLEEMKANFPDVKRVLFN